MKIKVAAAELKPYLDATAAIVPGTGKRPQLECTRIDADNGIITFSASNTIETVLLFYTGKSEITPGSVYLPSVNLLRVLKEGAKTQDVSIAWNPQAKNAQSATIRFGSTSVKLPVEPVENLPKIPRFDPKKPYITLPASALTGLLSRTKFAVQEDFNTRSLSGVSLKVRAGKLELAAADGRRIAIASCPLDCPTQDVDVVLPPITAKAVMWVVENKDDPVRLQFLQNSVRLAGPKGELTWRLLSGKFPDYEGHVPTSASKSMTLKRRALIEFLEHAKMLQVVSLTKYKFTLRPGEIEMIASSGVDGVIQATLPAEWTWPEMIISFDPELLVQALTPMRSEHVILGFEDSQSPALLCEVTTKLDNRYAVMARFESSL